MNINLPQLLQTDDLCPPVWAYQQDQLVHKEGMYELGGRLILSTPLWIFTVVGIIKVQDIELEMSNAA